MANEKCCSSSPAPRKHALTPSTNVARETEAGGGGLGGNGDGGGIGGGGDGDGGGVGGGGEGGGGGGVGGGNEGGGGLSIVTAIACIPSGPR